MMPDVDIRCIVDIFVKPGCEEKVRTILRQIVEDSRDEPGCIEYNVFENAADQFHYTLIEVWANEEAFENHSQSDHVQQASIDISGYLTRSPDIKRYKQLPGISKQSSSHKSSRLCTLL